MFCYISNVSYFNVNLHKVYIELYVKANKNNKLKNKTK